MQTDKGPVSDAKAFESVDIFDGLINKANPELSVIEEVEPIDIDFAVYELYPIPVAYS